MIDVPDAATLDDLFRASVRRHGARCALDLPPGPGRPRRRRWSYRELDAEVDRLACRIADALDPAAEPEALIGLMLPRAGVHLVASQLACWRLGLPWTHLDPGLPDARLAEMIEDGAIALILAPADETARRGPEGPPVLDPALDATLFAPASAPAQPRREPRPETAAYVIYTSGSSGKPKGVVIEHRSIVHLVRSDVEEFGLGPEDRCAQGSSAAYDSYLEEIWLALAVGGTVVVLDDDAIRLGPDLPEMLRRERITVLCPPPTLLRTMGLEDPRSALPELRLLYVGGEPLPPDVAAAWAPGRRLVNGYGPTECTVTVMRATIEAAGPVTIGHPISGHRAHVLDANLDAVAPGEVGELCLAGPGLARGYLRRPDLGAERFIDHPRLGRIYRTGDLVRVDAEGRHHYLGRADAQVKVRGHRIELEEIETRIAREPGVREVACGVVGEAIAAWIVPGPVEPDLELLRQRIASQLPAVMRPARYQLIAALPRTTGGKIDRRALGERPAAGSAALADSIASDPDVALVQAAFARSLGLEGPPDAEADFFGDLGGHSLAAALAISELRRDPRGRALTVRELYEHPRAAALAARLGTSAARRRDRVPPRAGPGRRALTTLIQTLVLGAALLFGAAGFSVALELGLPLLLGGRDAIVAALLFELLLVASAPLFVVLSVVTTRVAKRLLVGRFREGDVAAYGGFDLRRWLLSFVSASIPFGLLRGSGLDLSILRLLGARVGRRVWFDRGVDLRGAAWDLLEIGDDAVIGREATLGTAVLDRGRVIFGSVVVGARSVLETRAGMGPKSRLAADARLGALSYLDASADGAAGERLDGVPARPCGKEAPAVAGPDGAAAWRFGAGLIGSRLLVALVLGLPGLVYALSLATRLGLDRRGAGGAGLLEFIGSATGLAELVGVIVGLGLLDLGLRLAIVRGLGPTPRGRINRRSGAFLRRELRVDLLEGAGRLLSGTTFWPVWLRLAGMRIGVGSEISSIHECVPDEVLIGAGCFLADGVYLGAPRQEPGAIVVDEVALGDANFVGNHVVIATGTRLPDEVLLGIATPAPPAPVERGSAWFGHPPMRLPRREIVAADRALTHEPGPWRRLRRFGWEAARFTLGTPPVVAGAGALGFLLEAQTTAAGFEAHLIVAPSVFAAAGAALALLTIAAKWILLGRMKAGQHGLWSGWCSRWDFLYVAWQVWASPVAAPLEGTLWLVPWLRAFGVRIGRGVTLGRGFAQVVDPDMLRFGDGATVAGLFQAHSFEDRVLKLAPVWIGRDAGTEFGSVMMYGAELEEAARLRPHSVAMKHERLPEWSDHLGVPTRTVDARPAATTNEENRP